MTPVLNDSDCSHCLTLRKLFTMACFMGALL